MSLPKIVQPLSRISIYETKGFLLMCGYSCSSCTYHMLEIARPTLSISSDSLSFKPHAQSYSESQMEARLKQMKSVYKDLELVQNNVDCIYGIIKLLDSYYLIVVTKKRLVGSIVGHSIYTIEGVSYIPVTYKLRVTAEEPRYKSLLTSFDLTKNVYFSYTYDLSRSWQQQACLKDKISSGKIKRIETQDMFTWNNFALYPLLEYNKNDVNLDVWVMPVIYGYYRQKNIRIGDSLTLQFALIARRSRHFAGTRYLRRGSDCLGHVANEVETEQIFIRSTSNPGECPRVSSFVQCRGSIPLFWSHVNLYSPKPDVQLEDNGEGSEQSARVHFEKLFDRYGMGVHVMNLVKQTEPKPLEQIVGNAYRETVDTLNKKFCTELKISSPINFIAYDFLNMAKKQHALEAAGGEQLPNSPNVFRDLNKMCEDVFSSIGFYVDPPTGDLHAPNMVSFPIDETQSFGDKRVALSELDRQDLMLKKELRSLTKTSIDSESEDEFLRKTGESGVGKGVRTGLKQFGVMRTNCMDCLDRTNVAQFCFAKVAIPRQMMALGIALASQGQQAVISSCMEVWAEHGDTIATQYGGSGAMHKVDQQEDEEGENQFVLTGGAKNALVACQRFYSNISTDYERQQSMDLLLGIFEPKKDELHIWEHKLRARHLRVGKLGRRSSDLSKPLPSAKELLKTTVQSINENDEDSTPVESNADDKVSENYMAEYISESRAIKPATGSAAENGIIKSRKPGFVIEGLAGRFFHTASSVRISLTVFSDLVEESDIEAVHLNKVAVYPFPPSIYQTYGDEVLRQSVDQLRGEEGSKKTNKAASPMEERYDAYLKGEILFSPGVDFGKQNDSDCLEKLLPTLLAKLESIQKSGDSSVSKDRSKENISMSAGERVSSSSSPRASHDHGRLSSKEVPKTSQSNDEYFSFSDVYSSVKPEEKDQDSPCIPDSASSREPSRDASSQLPTSQSPPVPQRKDNNSVESKTASAPKKGSFFGLFGGKAKSPEQSRPTPPHSSPVTPANPEASSKGSTNLSEEKSELVSPQVKKSSNPHESKERHQNDRVYRSTMEAKEDETQNCRQALPPSFNQENRDAIRALDIKMTQMQRSLERLLDLKGAVDWYR